MSYVYVTTLSQYEVFIDEDGKRYILVDPPETESNLLLSQLPSEPMKLYIGNQ